MKRRAAVILVENGRVALIQRIHPQKVYYLFPGGTVEPGEEPEAAAVREAFEELGLEVALGALAAVVERNGALQYHYLAVATGGSFGTGQGEEMNLGASSERGSYTAVWMELSDLARHDVRPRALADALGRGALGAGGEPLRIAD